MILRRIALIASFISAGMQFADATEPLDSLFESWRKKPGSEAAEVRYTGTFDGKIRGFMFQRGLGNGWTYGQRISCRNAEQNDLNHLFATFDNSSQEVGHVVKVENGRACFDEKNMLGYACHYDTDNHTVYILRATVEDEVCIPYDWFTRNYYNGSIKQLTSPVWAATLARLYSELKYNYVFYNRNKAVIDSAYTASLPLIIDTDNNFDAYRILERFIATCNDGHTYIYAYGIEKPTNSAFTTVKLGDKIYIDEVESSSLDSAGMKRGMEVVAVNGIPVRQYADSLLKPYISASTKQWAEHIMYDNYGLSTGRSGMPLDLTLSNGKKNIEIKHQIAGALRDRHYESKNSLDYKTLKSNIGLLTISDFQSSTVTEMFNQVYDKILKTDGLIIDIRGNGGGNSGYADYIARHFSADSIRANSWSSPIYIPAFASWGNDAGRYDSPDEYYIPPIDDKKPYLNPVVILIDRGTFSAAEDFSALFKGMKRAVFIGEPTGGSTGNGVRVQLNDFVYANICSKHDIAPDGTEFVGIGIIPDIQTTETTESYFHSKTDNAIKAAIEVLRRK
ncbi:MAG: hypothetical protein K2I57_07935 [Muribaculaceae bacterium]|nr:hypothetical protein [Muribaculaceae bacterium]